MQYPLADLPAGCDPRFDGRMIMDAAIEPRYGSLLRGLQE